MSETNESARDGEGVGERQPAVLESDAGKSNPLQRLIPRGRAPIFFTSSYVAAFSAGFIYGGNREFVLYTIVMFAVIVMVAYLLRQVEIPSPLLWGLSAIGFLHMAGGGVHVDGERLYGYQLLDIYTGSVPGLLVFKYDQLIHLIGYGVFAVIVLFLLHRTAPQMNAAGRSLLAILAAMAAGSLNELAEFIAVLMLPSTGVGDYFNSMLDLSFNTLGAIAGVVIFETWARLIKRQ